MPSRKELMERLQRYLDEQMDPEEKALFEKQLEDDPELRRMLHLRRALARETAENGDLRQAAKGLINRFVKDLRRSKETGQRAFLTFDSGLLPSPVGIRPASIDTRRLKYAADDIRLEISIYPASPGSFEVIGQVEGYPPGVTLNITLARGRTLLRESANPFQVFHFARVPKGDYALTVADPEGRQVEFSLEL